MIIISEKNPESQTFDFINAFISSSKDPVIILDEDSKIIMYNKSFSQQFNVDEKKLKGEGFFDSEQWSWDTDLLQKKFNKVQKTNQIAEGIKLSYTSQNHEHPLLTVDIKPVIFGENQFFLFSISKQSEKQSAQELLKEIQIRDQISKVFLNKSDEETYHEVLNIILEIMDSKIGYFGYINEDGALVSPSLTREVWDKCQIPDKNIVFPKEDWGGIWGESLQKEESIIRNEGLTPPKGHVSLKNVLCVPIFHKKEVIGQIVVGNKQSDYTEKDKILLEKIANQISPILFARLERDQKEHERQQIEEKLRKSTNDDVVDLIDKQILHELFISGKKSLKELQKSVLKENHKSMSHTGINNRIDKLVDSDILKIQGNVNLKQLGFQAAFILIELSNYDVLKEYVAHAEQCPKVFLVAPTTGHYHLILGIVGKNIESINCCLNQCDLVGRKEIKNSEIMFAPQLDIPNFIPIDLFNKAGKQEEISDTCRDCESYKEGKCFGCGF